MQRVRTENDSASVNVASQRLKEIDSQIHKFVPGERPSYPGYHHRLRDLTGAEWKEIKSTIETFSFPCRLVAGPYGFWLAIHEHGPIPGVPTDVLLMIAHEQFPLPSAKGGFASQEGILKILSAITHRPRNGEVLTWYGFRPLHKDPSRYAY